jgi:hypothetical protein
MKYHMSIFTSYLPMGPVRLIQINGNRLTVVPELLIELPATPRNKIFVRTVITSRTRMLVPTKQTEYSLSRRDDCMDAGGRVTHGAVTERARESGHKTGS